LTVQTEGPRQVKRSVTLYRLEMILAVGYRVRSPRGTQFRRWATAALKEYLLTTGARLVTCLFTAKKGTIRAIGELGF